jgi:hypothetical protein
MEAALKSLNQGSNPGKSVNIGDLIGKLQETKDKAEAVDKSKKKIS